MTKLEASGPNAEQIEYWNDIAGARWVAHNEMLDAQIGEIGLAAIERAGVAEGERVLDVGCGCGQTTLQIAERVGPGGRVLGLDLSGPMLAHAWERTRDHDHVELLHADAQTHDFDEGSFDALFSRFGVMFFSDPVAAFSNLRRALAPGGRLAFACWQEIPKNHWILVPMGAIAQHMPLPEPPAPGSPGPFSFADAERVRGVLSDAGFGDVAVEPLEGTLSVGGNVSLDRAVEFVTQIGPAGQAFRDADDATRDKGLSAIREALAPHHGEDGVVLPFAVWIVTARNG